MSSKAHSLYVKKNIVTAKKHRHCDNFWLREGTPRHCENILAQKRYNFSTSIVARVFCGMLATSKNECPASETSATRVF